MAEPLFCSRRRDDFEFLDRHTSVPFSYFVLLYDVVGYVYQNNQVDREGQMT
jgi:hypothetical protein